MHGIHALKHQHMTSWLCMLQHFSMYIHTICMAYMHWNVSTWRAGYVCCNILVCTYILYAWHTCIETSAHNVQARYASFYLLDIHTYTHTYIHTHTYMYPIAGLKFWMLASRCLSPRQIQGVPTYLIYVYTYIHTYIHNFKRQTGGSGCWEAAVWVLVRYRRRWHTWSSFRFVTYLHTYIHCVHAHIHVLVSPSVCALGMFLCV